MSSGSSSSLLKRGALRRALLKGRKARSYRLQSRRSSNLKALRAAPSFLLTCKNKWHIYFCMYKRISSSPLSSH